jgi:hypothetical protein
MFWEKQDGKGGTINLLRGDVHPTTQSLIGCGGQDSMHPFLIQDYWYPYISGISDPGTRPIVTVDESSSINTQYALGILPGGGRPTSINNVVIRNIDFEAINWTGGAANRVGLGFSAPGSNWIIDNCIISNFGNANLMFESYPFTGLTIMNCIIKDSRIDNSVVSGHSQGLYLDSVNEILLSQNTFDNNGRTSADRTGRDIYSHNIYIQHTCGTAIVWGNTITNGGSYGIELRSGGILTYNYFNGDALAAFVDGPSGVQYRNVVENMQDNGPNTPRGIGLSMNSNFSPGTCQVITENLILHSAGHLPIGIIVDQSGNQSGPNPLAYGLVSHNTVIAAGGFQWSKQAATQSNTSIIQTANIYQPLVGSFLYNAPSGTTWGPTITSSDNDLIPNPSTTSTGVYANNYKETLPAWVAATGLDTVSISIAPQFVDGTVSGGDYAEFLGVGLTLTDLITEARQKPLDITDLFRFFADAYTPTNLPRTSSGDYYGAVPY